MSNQQRQFVRHVDLARLVDTEVNQRIGAQQEFTAWDITQALRTANPGLSIMHTDYDEVAWDEMGNEIARVNGLGVRSLVHDLMSKTAWFADVRDFDGNMATVWMPEAPEPPVVVNLPTVDLMAPPNFILPPRTTEIDINWDELFKSDDDKPVAGSPDDADLMNGPQVE